MRSRITLIAILNSSTTKMHDNTGQRGDFGTEVRVTLFSCVTKGHKENATLLGDDAEAAKHGS